MHRFLWVPLMLFALASEAQSPASGLAPGKPQTVPIDTSRALGAATARVAIVEFADYRCPSCRRFHVSTLPELQTRYISSGKVRFFYKDFPVVDPTQSVRAAMVAHCAGKQGKYWEMQELLFTEQARVGDELYAELAEELRLDKGGLDTCLRSPAARRRVETDRVDGHKLNIRGTPSFVLGYVEKDRVVVKRRITGAQELEAFVREIEALLAGVSSS